MRGRQQAHVHRTRLVGANGAHGPLLQHAQQFDLQRQRHVADLIQKQGAAIGRLEQAFAVAHGARKRTFHVAKQFRFQ